MNLVSPVDAADLERMRSHLDVGASGAALSRFWALLLLAAVIATAGVIADSTATVIGAMIVAPLMTPILGTVLAVVSGDRTLMVRSAGLVLAGASLAIGVGYVLAMLNPFDIVAASNGQVAGRVSPRLIDLVAALATGTVGAFAQCREDVSDTLPGVAIAISLVPPLTVVGLTAEAGAWEEAGGALLLFGTNVAAILLSGSLVMVAYGVHRVALEEDRRRLRRGRAAVVVGVFALVVVAPLTASTLRMNDARTREAEILRVARAWAEPAGWSIVGIDRTEREPTITAIGPPPSPDPGQLRLALLDRGVGTDTLRVRLVPEELVDLGE
jgi:uncharacterized hydrophobic protein (TIGR00271 family)